MRKIRLRIVWKHSGNAVILWSSAVESVSHWNRCAATALASQHHSTARDLNCASLYPAYPLCYCPMLTGDLCCASLTLLALFFHCSACSLLRHATAKVQHRFHECAVGALACHPDNVLVATGGADGTTKVINSKTAAVLTSFEGHADNIECVAFSRSSPVLLASGSLDGSVRIYDVTRQIYLHTCQHDVSKALERKSRGIGRGGDECR